MKWLGGAGGADEDRAALQLIGVERVHGLGEFGHHEVRHIHHVVDGVETDCGQTLLHPQRRWADSDVLDGQRAITGAQVEIFHADLYAGR